MLRKDNKSPMAGKRRGYAMTDLVVGATLLVGVMSFVAPLAVRSGRLWQDSRHYRLALDELSNQLERLTSLDENERDTALAELSVSPQVKARLPNPMLEARKINDGDGARLVLQLQWDRVGPAKPVTLVAWVDPLPPPTDANNILQPVETTDEESVP